MRSIRQPAGKHTEKRNHHVEMRQILDVKDMEEPMIVMWKLAFDFFQQWIARHYIQWDVCCFSFKRSIVMTSGYACNKLQSAARVTDCKGFGGRPPCWIPPSSSPPLIFILVYVILLNSVIHFVRWRVVGAGQVSRVISAAVVDPVSRGEVRLCLFDLDALPSVPFPCLNTDD